MEKLGKYLILGELGRGAGGIVYRARDPIINRLVALKTITTGLAAFPDWLQRFYQEAQSAGCLQHPNIVTIFDMGDEGGIPYIAMELVDGGSLDQLIARKIPLLVPLKLTYAVQACYAFDYAHKRGIVHRDIKPDNVMLTKEGTVKVVDFGIARVFESTRTQTGMLLGTFAYMSPEQYQGEHADARSDIWSFGVLMYELFSYQRPFKGQTPASLMQSICQQEPLPLNEVVAECPAALARVLERALRKDPADRYQSMEELLLDLDPICRSLQAETLAGLVEHGRKCAGEGDFSQARDLLRQALQIDSTHAPARNLLEKVNMELRRIQVRPRVQQHVERSHALLIEGRIQEARAEADSALELDASFEAAQNLKERIQGELERARRIAEWIELSRQWLAEGNPERAEEVLAKVFDVEPSNQQARVLQLQVTEEKAERQRRVRLHENLTLARSLWTQQNYSDCIQLLTNLQREFPNEEEIPGLLGTAREDQASQRRLQGLAEGRRLLANRLYNECTAWLAELQKQFPSDEEIPKLQKKVLEDQTKQRRLRSLAEARNLLAARRYDDSISLLTSLHQEFPNDDEIRKLQNRVIEDQATERKLPALTEARRLFGARRYDDCDSLLASLQKEFPDDEEIVALQKNVSENQRKQRLSEAMTEARSLLAAQRYDDCTGFLTTLQREFPDEDEIPKLLETTRENRAEQRRREGVVEARKMLAARQYDKCSGLLLQLQKQFPKSAEISELIDAVRKDEAEERKLKGLREARGFLASREYEQCIELLTELGSQFPEDDEILKLLETTREDQAEQHKLQGLADARLFLASRQYEECIAFLVKLQKTFPGDDEIAKLLETAREDRAEQYKQQKLREARTHLAAKRFGDAMSILQTLLEAHPKDTGVQKLCALVVREQDKQAGLERLQRELKATRDLVSEKKYLEVLSRSESILSEFPGSADLARLIEFARTQQAQIERELQQEKIVQEARHLFEAGRFEEAFQTALAGLKMFPENQELQFLREQADTQQRKLETRQQIEQKIREIKFKINRGKFSEAIDLANQTLVTMGPDTDLSQLLNSARVEFEARERKREQERNLDAIRALIDSGKFDEAATTLDQVVVAKELDGFDPRVQRVSEEIEAARFAASAPAGSAAGPSALSSSREYAWLQPPPSPDVSVPEEARPPTNVTDLKATVSPAAPPDEPLPVPPEAPPNVVPLSLPIQPAEPVSAGMPMPAARGSEVPIHVPETQPRAEALPAPGASAQKQPPFRSSLWRRPATLAGVTVGVIGLIWAAVHSFPPGTTRLNEHSSLKTPGLSTPKVETDAIELQQRDAIKTADRLVAANDLEGALRSLEPAASLSGPLTAQIENKRASIEESMQNQKLRDIRQREEQLWQQAQDDVSAGRWAEAQKSLRKILILGDGGLRKNDAQQYLVQTIPARQREEKLFSQAEQASKGSDPNSLGSATNLLRQVIALEGPRKSAAEQLQKNVRAKLFDFYTSGAHQDLQRGDFYSAREKAGWIQRNGGEAGGLVGEIDQTEQTQLAQLETQFNQLRQSDDDAAPQQLSGLQRTLQGIVNGAGPKAGEAKDLADKIPAATREVRERAATKRAEAAYQQIVLKYQQASSANDKSGLETARSAFQSVAQADGPHAGEAQKFLQEISAKLAARNEPAPVPVPPESVSGSADRDAVLALVTRYAEAFESRNADALRLIWPAIGRRYLSYKNSFESASAIHMQIQTEVVQMGADGRSAGVTAQFTEEYTPQGQKPRSVKGRTIFRFEKSNGAWTIADVQ